MRLNSRIIFLFLLSFGGVFSSNAHGTYHLEGYMGVRGGESFHYVLDLKDSVGDLLSGYASTYNTKDKAVKATVTALIDRKAKTLHIQEQEIVANLGFESKATICLVNAVLSWNEHEKTLSGSLITQTSENGATCSTGSIVFTRKAQIDQLLDPPAPAIASKSMPADNNSLFQPKTNPTQKLNAYFAQKEQQEAAKFSSAQDTKPGSSQPPIPQPEVKKITEGTDGIYLWQSNKIIFEIWDGGDIDNDQVSISFNGTSLLKNYQLTAQKKKLVFDLGADEINTITITANNEGANLPNTANILLGDGDKTYSVLAYNKTGKTAVIKIKRVN